MTESHRPGEGWGPIVRCKIGEIEFWTRRATIDDAKVQRLGVGLDKAYLTDASIISDQMTLAAYQSVAGHA